jgi:predicted nucleotidyltransferase
MDISISQISKVIKTWAIANPEIVKVFIFGSRARGDSLLNSDVDLALVVVDAYGESVSPRSDTPVISSIPDL